MFRKLRAVWVILTTPPCMHLWRPAIHEKEPARYCSLCKVCEKMTEGEFYAQFGRMPWNTF